MKFIKFKRNVITGCIITAGLVACSNEESVKPQVEDDVPVALEFEPSRYDVKNESGVLSRTLVQEEALQVNIEKFRVDALAQAKEKLREELELRVAQGETIDIDTELAAFETNFPGEFRANTAYDGNKKTYDFVPTNKIVSEMDELAAHFFAVENLAQVDVPQDDKCPGEADYLISEDSVAENITFLNVNNGDVVTNVTRDDEVTFRIDVPQNRYGVTYQAELDYAGTKQQFSVTTPEAVIQPKELDFYDGNTVRVQNFFSIDEEGAVVGSSQLFNFDGKTNSIKFTAGDNDQTILPTIDVINEDEQLLLVPPGYVYTFITKKPMTGNSAFARSSFDFNYDSSLKYELQKYNVVNGQYNDLGIETIDAIQVRTISQTYDIQEYSGARVVTTDDGTKSIGCAAPNDLIAVSFHVPEDAYSKTLTADLVWSYFDPANQAVDTPKTYTFTIKTQALDAEPRALDLGLFALNSKGVSPSETIEYEVELDDYNGPVAISGTDVEFSIDGGAFTSDDVTIKPNQRLVVRVNASAESGKTTSHSLVVGSKTYDWEVVTASDFSAKTLKFGMDYPSEISATVSGNVTLRGHAEFIQNDIVSYDGISISNILVNNSPVDTFDTDTGIWTKSVTTELGVDSSAKDYTFELTTDGINTDLLSHKKSIMIRRLPDETTKFPLNVDDYGSFSDITFDKRAASFYLADKDGQQLVKFPLANDFDGLNITNKNSPFLNYSSVNAVQVNNMDTMQRRYIYRVADVNTGLIQASVIRNGYIRPQVSNDAKLNGVAATVAKGSHTVFDDLGKTLYMTGSNEIAEVTPNYNTIDNDGNVLVPFRDNEDFVHTHKTTISTQFSSQSVDILTTAGTQYIVALSRADDTNSGENNIWYIKKASSYNVETSATMLTLVYADDATDIDGNDISGQPYMLNQATSIAIDDKQQKAYVTNGGNMLAEVDLSTMVSGTTAGTVQVTEKAFASPENTVGKLTSVIMEGGLPYLVATDGENDAVFAIDQYTGESVYLLQANRPEPEAPAAE